MRNITQLTPEEAAGIRYILHDVDDTITNEGKLTAQGYGALWKLTEAGYQVIPVTGRPAGWCDMMLRQWPVKAVIGENGAFVDYFKGSERTRFVHPSVAVDVGERLGEIRVACLKEVPGCRVSKDQHYRIYDLAIDFNEDEPRLGFEAAEQIKKVCERFGAVAKVSSIHVNTWFGDYNKVAMAELFLKSVCGVSDLEKEVLFLGDSPNDEPMFARFPLSCGVANIEPFLGSLTHLPTFVTKKEGGFGFAEAAEVLLRNRIG